MTTHRHPHSNMIKQANTTIDDNTDILMYVPWRKAGIQTLLIMVLYNTDQVTKVITNVCNNTIII